MCAETWAKSENAYKNAFPGYFGITTTRVFRPKQKGRGRGGLIAFVKNKWKPYVTKLDSESRNILWLKFDLHGKVILFGLTYFSPANSTGHDAKELMKLYDTPI